MRVLVVEDDREVRTAVAEGLRRAGFAVDEADRWARADLQIAVNTYDCLVVDRMLPDGDGSEGLHRLRAAGTATPALLLTALDALSDRVAGFARGADDYLVKPFAMEELVMRVRALSRRRGQVVASVLRNGDLEVDLALRTVRRDGVLLTLRPKEFGVLELLLSAAPAAVSRSTLIEHCWDEMADPASNVVEVLIGRLRRKLGDPAVIHTVRGFGYRLGPE
ncbi:response regulator transcription factor [Catenulispora subtropica]|uniref:Response regulator transcription factor n=1 Tax=Catenulispora subtropica TaxID=450798 RepID=A0ABP5CL88_9ACTN